MRKVDTSTSDTGRHIWHLTDNSPIDDPSFTGTELCGSLLNQTVETLLDKGGIIYVGRDDDGDVDVSLDQRVIGRYRGKTRTQNLIGVLGDNCNIVSISTRFFEQDKKPVHIEDDFFFRIFIGKSSACRCDKEFRFPFS